MTNTQHDENAPETPENATNTPEEPEAPQEPQEAPERGNREAAKYRRQLRDTEAERDRLRTQLTATRLEATNQLLTSGVTIPHEGSNGQTWDRTVRLRNAEDLYTLGGVDPSELWAEDGTLDSARVAEVVSALHKSRPELFAPNSAVIPTMGKVPNRTTIQNRFEAAFEPRDW